MPTEWYCLIDGTEYVLETAEHLRKMALSGRLTRDDFVRKGKTGDFISATRVKGLFDGINETYSFVTKQPDPPPAPSTPLLTTVSRPTSPEDEPEHPLLTADRPAKSKASRMDALTHDGRSLESQSTVRFRLRKFLLPGVFAFLMLSLLIAWTMRPARPTWPPDFTRYPAGRDLVGVWEYGVYKAPVYGRPGIHLVGEGNELYIFHPNGTGEHKPWYFPVTREAVPMQWTCDDKYFYICPKGGTNSLKWEAPQNIAKFIEDKKRLLLHPQELVGEWTGRCSLGDIDVFRIRKWGHVFIDFRQYENVSRGVGGTVRLVSSQFFLEDGQLKWDDSTPFRGHIVGTLNGGKGTVKDVKYLLDIERKDQTLIVTARDALNAALWTTVLQPKKGNDGSMPPYPSRNK